MAFRLDTEDVACITVANPQYNIKEVCNLILARLPTLRAVIIESFLGIQYRGNHGIDTLELIGAVRGVCAVQNILLVKQAPIERKGKERAALALLEERKIKYKLAYTPHEVSALAHLLTYEARHGNTVSTSKVRR